MKAPGSTHEAYINGPRCGRSYLNLPLPQSMLLFEISNVLSCWAVQALKPAVARQDKQDMKPEGRTGAHRQALAFWFILPLQVALHLIVDGFIQAQRLPGGDHRAAMPAQVFSVLADVPCWCP